MKNIIFLIAVFFVDVTISFSQTSPPTMDFTVDVYNIPGGYSPSHVLAIWIEDANGKYVNSLAVYGTVRLGHLVVWNGNSRGVKGSAISGATLRRFQTHNVSWDLTNYAGNKVPDGNYKLLIESTAGNRTGPLRTIDFTVGNKTYTETPSSDTHYKNMKLDFNSDVNTSVKQVFSGQPSVSIFPNPTNGPLTLKINLQESGFANVLLYSVSGQYNTNLYNGYIPSGLKVINLNTEGINSGLYFLVVKCNDFSWTTKLLVK